MSIPMIRLGIEGNRKPIMEYVRRENRPILISANSLWKRGKFTGWKAYEGLDVALDSGGFVAMKLHGGYRFTAEQYAKLAAEMNPTWWAQMDFCCEPEIAGDAAMVARRIDMTAEHLSECRKQAALIGAKMPMPVLQGWKPSDYCRGPAYDNPDFEWPELVGVGSVCRRHLHGPDSLTAVIGALDCVLPPHVKLHLFGVKGRAVERLKDHPRFSSMDSMAWDRAARWDSRHQQIPCSGELKARHIERWDVKQSALLAHPQMSFGI